MAVSGIMERENHITEFDKFDLSEVATGRRPKLLFLAYPFPPAKAPGCVRTWNIAMHLTRLGWDVTVVTPDPAILRNVEDDGKVSLELEREGIKRILTGQEWRCLAPNNLKSWNQDVGKFAGLVCRVVARRLGLTGISVG
ncbi:hypothetical protein YTPLAS72_18400 [Nitrospira sp.]|nr:hypothetical protein YTPLAS72_18400 [Nitrospira sp.]